MKQQSASDYSEPGWLVKGVGDRLLLFASALVVGAVLFGWMIFADRGIGLAREQHLFIGGVLVYIVTTLYFLQQQVLRRLHHLVKKTLAMVVVAAPPVLFLLLFSSGAIPWPRSMFPYFAGTIVLAPVAVIGVDWLFRRGGAQRTKYRK